MPLGPEGHLVRLHVNPNAANLSSNVGTLLALSDEFAQLGVPTLTTEASSAAPTLKEGASVNKSKLRKVCPRMASEAGPSATEKIIRFAAMATEG